MVDSKSISIFRTNKVPVTHISQNHLDALHTAIDNFCELNKEYEWHYVGAGYRKIKGDKSVAYVNKHEPRTLHYLVTSRSYERELLIDIDNGITVNLKNGSYLLYGLYALINDTVDIIKVPAAIVYLRRYWLLNAFLAGWFIPALILLIFGNVGGAIAWLISFPLVLFTLTGIILDEKDNFIDKLEWEDVVLSTKIQYKAYHSKVGSPILSLLSSTKAMISIAASLATIFSFIFYLVQR
jgi:hypothetical protein